MRLIRKFILEFSIKTIGYIMLGVTLALIFDFLNPCGFTMLDVFGCKL